MTTHLGTLSLRRLLAGEHDEAHAAHLAGCAQCQATLEGFKAEQAQFEAKVPFERFAAQVQARARQPVRALNRRVEGQVAFALAATVLLLVGTQRLWQQASSTSRLKGGAGVELVVAGPGGTQRVAAEGAPEALVRGERVRIGVLPAGWHFVLVVSVDAQGAVTPIYADGTHSLPLSGESPQFLPDSLEFTGQGLEHVVVLLSDRALDVDVVGHALREQFAAVHGELTQLTTLEVPGEQFHRTFLKP
jgi:hypothetical protein